MNEQQFEKAKKLVTETKILSSLERAEWLQLLPSMDDKQILELIRLLSPQAVQPSAQAVASIHSAVEHLAAQQMAQVDIKQKEISTSIPFYEKELPQHATMPAMPVSPIKTDVKPKPVPPPITAAPGPVPSLKDAAPVRSAVPPSLVNKPAPFKPDVPKGPPPSMSVPAMQQHNSLAEKIKSVQSGVPAQAHPAQPARPAKLEFNSVEDFAKLSPEFLHGKDSKTVFKAILDSATQYVKNEKALNVIYNIEQSPLYQAYINYGLSVLNGSTVQNALSREEFEAFADFRKELDKLVI